MIIEKGELVLISHRRLYEGDPERYFLGEVQNFVDGLIRVRGNTWLHDVPHGHMIRKDDERTKVISLSSGHMITYVLPRELSLPALKIEQDGHRIFLLNDEGFNMDISDRLPS